MRRALLLVFLAGCTGGATKPSLEMPASADVEMAGNAGGAGGAGGNRPGLGTEWGEQRDSLVTRVQFERCGPTPDAVVAVHYDDGPGIAAMLERDLGRGYAPNAQSIGDVTVSIVDAAGRALPGLAIGQRTYVVGELGERYEIEVANDSPQRWEIVASVDGLDVIDGRPASLAKRGYVLGGNSTVRIDGWRTSDRDVAAFRFGDVADSYAARTSGDRNVGVIGVALFCERGVEPEPIRLADPVGEVDRRQSAEPFPYARPPD